MTVTAKDRVHRFDADELRTLAAKRLLRAAAPCAGDPAVPARRGDGELDAGFTGAAEDARPPRPAAVLIGLVPVGDELAMLFTQRTDDLRSHPGQISLPGGKLEEGDGGPVGAALRETHEETGIDPGFVEVLGLLDTYQTRTGYRIVPVVGLLRHGFSLRPEPGEVAEIFEVPLRFLMDRANHRRDERVWQGRARRFYAMPYGKRYIWGATAGIVRNLYERLYLPDLGAGGQGA